MSLREQGKARRRERILGAAVTLLSEEGVEGFTTARLAERAEVSVATLYNLIGSREAILDELVGWMFQSFQSFLDARCDERIEPLQRIDRYALAASDFIRRDEASNRAALRAIFSLNLNRGSSPLVHGVSRRGHGLLLDALSQCQQQGQLHSAAQCELMAEQMVFSHSILLESWAAGFISTERFSLTCRLHFWTVVNAWADPSLALQLQSQLEQIHREIAALDNSPVVQAAQSGEK
jgi:AcrR family transcriptional regulator